MGAADKHQVEEYLKSLWTIGRSSPAGIYWDRTFRAIVKDFPKDTWPGNPLILGGSIASDIDKHQRFREHMLWPDCGWNVLPSTNGTIK